MQRRLLGMGQSKADQWILDLLVVLQATLRALGDFPRRFLAELANRVGTAEADAGGLVVPTEGGQPQSIRPRRLRHRCPPPPFGHDVAARRIGGSPAVASASSTSTVVSSAAVLFTIGATYGNRASVISS
jgi:hypothetical protein